MEHIADTRTLKAPAERFTGDVYLNMFEAPAEPARLAVGLMRFTPGARTNWHSHALGNGTGDGTTWLEPVTDEQYAAALASISH
jgi:quercetin dioxygenase-like cupin family protein